MACRIEAAVLALAIGKIFEVPNNPRAAPAGTG